MYFYLMCDKYTTLGDVVYLLLMEIMRIINFVYGLIKNLYIIKIYD
jgi:hypothetical protein